MAQLFYQALGTCGEDAMLRSRGEGGVGQNTAHNGKENCIGCHDNGPFIRSPYLAQLMMNRRTAFRERIQGRAPAAQKIFLEIRPSLHFVGDDFQSWKCTALGFLHRPATSRVSSVALSSRRVNSNLLVFFDGSAGNPLQGSGDGVRPIATATGTRRPRHQRQASTIWMKQGHDDLCCSR